MGLGEWATAGGSEVRGRKSERASRQSSPGPGPSAGVGESASSGRLQHSPHCVPVE